MCRSNGSRVDGSETGAGCDVRDLIDVGREGNSVGWSPSVLTVHRSTPHATRAVAADAFEVRGGFDAQDVSRPATVTRATAAVMRRRRADMPQAYATACVAQSLGNQRRAEIAYDEGAETAGAN